MRDFSNLAGAILGFGYCLYYIYIMIFKDNRKKFFICLCLIIISLLLFILLALFVSAGIYEYIGIFFNVFEYLPLGFDLFYLIKHKISEKFILFSAIPGIINTIIWLIWAAIKVAKDNEKYHSLIANIFGFLLCLTQFIIISVFKSDDHPNDAIIESTNDINMKENVEEEKKENSDLDEIMIL